MKYIVMAVVYLVLSSCQQRTYSYKGIGNEGWVVKKTKKAHRVNKRVYHFTY